LVTVALGPAEAVAGVESALALGAAAVTDAGGGAVCAVCVALG
jgi:hypothetical protein